MFRIFAIAARTHSRQAATWLRPLGLVCMLSLGAALSQPADATETAASVLLPKKPSELLVASDATWKPVLAVVHPLLEAKRAEWAQLTASQKIEWHIHQAVLAQSEGRWQAALDAVRAARDLQSSESGRQSAGLLNELLAQHALAGGDEADLRRRTATAVLAMNWAEVATAIQGIRQALATMDGRAVEALVANRMDASTTFTKGQANLAFVMQLLAARFQVQQVLPHRAALLMGLDDAIARRTAETAGEGR
ncbi:hypothetical protein [Roseateles asaccharophilus]|uniref:Secreted protein n=1 Tax=Roseateles asaccharophilus TaxID=582607 RepID=A0ABU2ABX1_9BURK|nr:hypothetical protein [Roseateles asaccharophilus]MDR7334695.1 hypothetical protein [Roseateles asaccharophilus]